MKPGGTRQGMQQPGFKVGFGGAREALVANGRGQGCGVERVCGSAHASGVVGEPDEGGSSGDNGPGESGGGKQENIGIHLEHDLGSTLCASESVEHAGETQAAAQVSAAVEIGELERVLRRNRRRVVSVEDENGRHAEGGEPFGGQIGAGGVSGGSEDDGGNHTGSTKPALTPNNHAPMLCADERWRSGTRSRANPMRHMEAPRSPRHHIHIASSAGGHARASEPPAAFRARRRPAHPPHVPRCVPSSLSATRATGLASAATASPARTPTFSTLGISRHHPYAGDLNRPVCLAIHRHRQGFREIPSSDPGINNHAEHHIPVIRGIRGKRRLLIGVYFQIPLAKADHHIQLKRAATRTDRLQNIQHDTDSRVRSEPHAGIPKYAACSFCARAPPVIPGKCFPRDKVSLSAWRNSTKRRRLRLAVG